MDTILIISTKIERIYVLGGKYKIKSDKNSQLEPLEMFQWERWKRTWGPCYSNEKTMDILVKKRGRESGPTASTCSSRWRFFYCIMLFNLSHQYPTAETPYSACPWEKPSYNNCSIKPSREKDVKSK